MKELLENGRNGKTEPRVELLFGKINGIVSDLFYGYWILLH